MSSNLIKIILILFFLVSAFSICPFVIQPCNYISWSSGCSIGPVNFVNSSIYYDSNNSNYYVDPSGTTKLNLLSLNGLSSDLDLKGHYVKNGPAWVKYVQLWQLGSSPGIFVIWRDSSNNLRWSTDTEDYIIATREWISDNYYTKSDSDSRFVNVVGDTMYGDIDMNSHSIKNVGYIGIGTSSPSYGLDVINKQIYVYHNGPHIILKNPNYGRAAWIKFLTYYSNWKDWRIVADSNPNEIRFEYGTSTSSSGASSTTTLFEFKSDGTFEAEGPKNAKFKIENETVITTAIEGLQPEFYYRFKTVILRGNEEITINLENGTNKSKLFVKITENDWQVWVTPEKPVVISAKASKPNITITLSEPASDDIPVNVLVVASRRLDTYNPNSTVEGSVTPVPDGRIDVLR